MNMTTRTRITDLATVGQEICEEHLRLVTGGRVPFSNGDPVVGGNTSDSTAMATQRPAAFDPIDTTEPDE